MGRARTGVPVSSLRLMGDHIRGLLREEHILYFQRRGERKAFNLRRVGEATGIPAATMNAYLTGNRLPNIVDLRELAKFLSEGFRREITMEMLMSTLPSKVDMWRLWKEEEAARKEGMARLEEQDG